MQVSREWMRNLSPGITIAQRQMPKQDEGDNGSGYGARCAQVPNAQLQVRVIGDNNLTRMITRLAGQ